MGSPPGHRSSGREVVMGRLSRRTFVGGVGAAGTVAATGYLGTASAATASLLDDRMASGSAWSSFLSSQDLMWKRIPTNWYDGPFLGNGFLGALLYQPGGTRSEEHTSELQSQSNLV